MLKRSLWIAGFLVSIVSGIIIQTSCVRSVHKGSEIETDSMAETGHPGSPAIVTNGKVPAFPGAEGFGKYASGGREGEVYIVTNLADSGAGSLRESVEKEGPRIIVFEVSGTIELESDLEIDDGNLTIAGQSAPGDGICLRNYPVEIKADNVIIRYLRFRMGDKKGVEGDAIGARNCRNVIIDHCSISWATDECASFYNNDNFTLQWSIISESLNHSVHEKGNHGYGGIWGGRGASFHHNLIAHHTSRNPRFSGSSSTANSPEELVDFRNNVIYNWQHHSIYGGEKGRYNIVANVFKSGPATQNKKRYEILEPYQPFGRFYLAENIVVGSVSATRDNWLGVHEDTPDSAMQNHEFLVEHVITTMSDQVLDQVLSQAGASHSRDSVDQRIIHEVRTGTARFGNSQDGIINSQSDVGGWPELKSKNPLPDNDRDGIPDQWEILNGLNPKLKPDASHYDLDPRYTNIEVYINQIQDRK